MKPLADYVIILPEPKKKVSDGGIIIPEGVRNSNPFFRGKVIDAGPQAEIEPGVDVLFSAHAGTLIEDGKKRLAVKFDHIWAIL